jgi:Na+-transporting methylmalonyl-CoA/oxaloacetate decarboxylase gamma subunit
MNMWKEALSVATVGFSVVFVALLILTVSVWVMSFFCNLNEKKKETVPR